MATVRLTETLRQTISHNAYSLFDAELKSIKSANPDDILTHNVVHAMMNERFNLLDKAGIPRLWAAEKATYLHAVVKDTRLKNHYIRYRVMGTTPMVTADIAAKNEIQLPHDAPHYEDLMEHLLRKEEFQTRRDQFMQTVNTLLKNVTTLKQFLKHWPEGEKIIPQEALDRHHEHHLSAKRRKEQADIEIDRENLTTELSKQTILSTTLNK